jgi:GNAT superfamily N-acetyltransferase
MLPTDYVLRLRQVFSNGARMLVAVDDDKVVGLAVWRLIENTYEGLRLYVDDLVTDENERCKGIGKALLQHLEAKAKGFGCNVLTLDSGVQRAAAHKFYFREGMHIASYCFRKSL